MLREALEAHLQWLQKDGDDIPIASPVVTVNLKDDPDFPNPLGYYVVVEQLEVSLPRKRRGLISKTTMRERTAA